MCVGVCVWFEECVGEVKTAAAPITGGSPGAVARYETDTSETAQVSTGRTEQDAKQVGVVVVGGH